MLRTIDRITYRNGFLLNGQQEAKEKIEQIYDGKRAAALSVWEQYEHQKQKLRLIKLTPEQYQNACRDIAKALGV